MQSIEQHESNVRSYVRNFPTVFSRAEGSRMYDAAGRVDVYGMVVTAFSDPLTAGLYLFAMALLGLHLVHAIEGLFQTLGFNHDSYQGLIRVLAPTLTLLVVGGFAAIPVLVLAGAFTGGG